MPQLGFFVNFIRSPIGIIICIAIPLVLLLAFEILNLFSLAKVPKVEPDEEVEEIAPPEEERAKMFGTHTGRFSLKGFTKSAYNKQDKGIEETGLITTPITVENDPNRITTVKDDEDKKPKHRITTKNDEDMFKPQHKITTKKDEEAMRPTNSTHKITTLVDEVQDEETKMQDEIVDSMNAFAFIKPKNISEGKDGLRFINKFANGLNELALVTTQEGQSFSSDVTNNGADSFNIDGINVYVNNSSLQLELDKKSRARDISISVTDEYTSIVVDSKDYEINFAMFKDVSDDEQKVVIQRKVK